MEVKDDRLVGRKQRIEVGIRQAMWMFCAGLQLEQVNHVDESDLQVRKPFSEQRCGCQCFLGGDVARGSKNNIGFLAFIITGPIPDTDTLCAVGNGSINIQVLQMLLLVRDNYVDVVFRAQAMICYGQQTIGIRREVNAGYCGALIEHYIEKPRILVCEAVVILTPHG
jgi:hypothetical protein